MKCIMATTHNVIREGVWCGGNSSQSYVTIRRTMTTPSALSLAEVDVYVSQFTVSPPPPPHVPPRAPPLFPAPSPSPPHYKVHNHWVTITPPVSFGRSRYHSLRLFVQNPTSGSPRPAQISPNSSTACSAITPNLDLSATLLTILRRP